jgi:signal peptidase II
MPVQFLMAVGLTLALDQTSKQLAVTRLPAARRRPGGLALGLIRDPRVLAVLWGVAVLGTILLMRYAAPLQSRWSQLALGAAVGGASSNLFDTLRRGAVIDFIDLRIWPIFNVADAAIVLGVIGGFWSML